MERMHYNGLDAGAGRNRKKVKKCPHDLANCRNVPIFNTLKNKQT